MQNSIITWICHRRRPLGAYHAFLPQFLIPPLLPPSLEIFPFQKVFHCETWWVCWYRFCFCIGSECVLGSWSEFCWWKSLLGNLLAVQQEKDWQNLKVKTKRVSREARLPLWMCSDYFFRRVFSAYVYASVLPWCWYHSCAEWSVCLSELTVFAAVSLVGKWSLYKDGSDLEEPIWSLSGRVKSNWTPCLANARKRDQFWCCNTRTVFQAAWKSSSMNFVVQFLSCW